MMVKNEGVANGYTKYIYFIHPLDTMDGSRIISCDLMLFNVV